MTTARSLRVVDPTHGAFSLDEGWRFWVTARQDPPLRSPLGVNAERNRGQPWHGRDYVARCGTREPAPHPAPLGGCSCGVRVLDSPDAVAEYLLAYRDLHQVVGGTSTHIPTDVVIGRVSVHGRQVAAAFSGAPDDDAVRAERVRIEELHVPQGHRDADRLARWYRVPVVESDKTGPAFWTSLGPRADPARVGCVPCRWAPHLTARRPRPSRADYPICATCRTRAPGWFGT